MTAGLQQKLGNLSYKTYWREVLAVFMLLVAIIFFRSERKELQSIIPSIEYAHPLWLFMGLILTVLYIILQAGIYKKSFSAIGLALEWGKAIILFLKRNFVSVFLPAGSVSSLAYSPSQIRKAGFNQTQVHQASALFWFAGMLTIFIAGLPVLIYTVYHQSRFQHAWLGLILVAVLITGVYTIIRSVQQKRSVYKWINKRFSSIAPTINELFSANVNVKIFYGAVIYSLGIELSGILHVYIAMLALGLPASFGAAASTYIIAVLFMMVSPFLRGLGAVELSMVYVLEQFGYTSIQALSITILFRLFEFWLPLLAGLLAFAWKGRKLFLRLAPALLTFTLGIINIISVVTPPVHQRLRLLREYIPLSAINASNLLILFVGLFLLVTAAFLFRGLRNAWIIAISFSFLSLIGHLSKALDYEEAILAAVTVIILISTAGQYRIRSSNKWMQAGVKTALLGFLAVLIFGFISYYFIDKRHFGVDFTWQQSLLHTVKIFLLVEDDMLHPITRFGQEFISLVRTLSFLTWGFLLFTLIQPHIFKHTTNESFKERARFLLSQYGNSTTDYFKLYKDKLYFFSDLHDAFIAYRIAGGFAIVLEEPVCAGEYKVEVITEFERHCRKMGLKTAFYRVDENSIPWFNELNKNKLKIGQEAILEINNFTLEGKDKKSLRNGLNSLQKNGYSTTVRRAPLPAALLSELKNVSDEWLKNFRKEELIFSQGMYDEKEIQQQDVITVQDAEGNIKAFLNIIPDYSEDECTYDLIRKNGDAPGAAMDALIIKLIEYARERKLTYLNLGMVPMMGITQPDSTAEQLIKLAAARIRRFQQYRGLREFKEKYATFWQNKYLVYENDFDLLQLPNALNKVMQP